MNSSEQPFVFDYKKNDNWLFNISIKRPITKVGNYPIKEKIFDLETAYGYGGICTNSRDEKFISKALTQYRHKCISENIVAEFFRFHPFNVFPINHPDIFDFISKDRPTIFIDLNQSYENIFKNFKSALRRNIRKANKNNLVFKEMEKTGENIEAFRKLYYLTMKKNRADKFYFFSDEYFRELLNKDYARLFGVYYGGHLTNAGIFLFSPPFIYYHLGASDPKYYTLNGNPLLFSEICRLFSFQYGILYLGGGNSSNPKDSLYQFKRKFSDKINYFYIGGIIYNNEKYNELLDLWEQQNPDDDRVYFLKYRLE
ncbi:MAG: hypothetical protein ABEK36_01860 [Candidatus Aenigmatarchaeota archaeon]